MLGAVSAARGTRAVAPIFACWMAGEANNGAAEGLGVSISWEDEDGESGSLLLEEAS